MPLLELPLKRPEPWLDAAAGEIGPGHDFTPFVLVAVLRTVPAFPQCLAAASQSLPDVKALGIVSSVWPKLP